MERIQSIIQVLDKRGIDQYGEVSIPGDAVPLIVRTIKSDGHILDAEAVPGKETISASNLEPGDFVEYVFLRAAGPRQAGVPGWAGGQFFFRGDEIPFFESTYVVRAPTSLGLELDSEHLDPPARLERSGDTVTMTYTRHGAEPYLREPLSVTDPEVLPWVEAGYGAGQDAIVAQAADFLPLKARTSSAVENFVRGISDLPPSERVRAVVDRIRDRVRGDSSSMDFGDSVAAILTRGRGNRMLVLKVALDAVGIPSHVVFARPYNEYQHSFRFPHGGTFHIALLRIEASQLRHPCGWISPGWLAPLNRIPSTVSGEGRRTLSRTARMRSFNELRCRRCHPRMTGLI